MIRSGLPRPGGRTSRSVRQPAGSRVRLYAARLPLQRWSLSRRWPARPIRRCETQKGPGTLAWEAPRRTPAKYGHALSEGVQPVTESAAHRIRGDFEPFGRWSSPKTGLHASFRRRAKGPVQELIDAVLLKRVFKCSSLSLSRTDAYISDAYDWAGSFPDDGIQVGPDSPNHVLRQAAPGHQQIRFPTQGFCPYGVHHRGAGDGVGRTDT